MFFRGRNVRVHADYRFHKEYGDLFTVEDMTSYLPPAPSSDPERGLLKFTREAADTLGVRAGSEVYFKFFATPSDDDFVLELYDEDGQRVDALYVSDLRMTWATALVMAITDISRDGGLVE